MVEYWYEQIKLSSNDDIIIYLLGNKKDLVGNRAISQASGYEKAKRIGMNRFVEISAKTKENLMETFREFYMEIYHKNKKKYMEKKNNNLKMFENLQKLIKIIKKMIMKKIKKIKILSKMKMNP